MNLTQLDQVVLRAGESWPAGAWTALGVTPHLVAPLPDESWLRTHSVAELLDFLNDRNETIRLMEEDPFRHGYEPFSWRILDAFCGFPWIDPSEASIAAEPDEAKRADLRASAAWCLAVRRLLLHQDERVMVLYLFGGNRSGKSEWAASRVVKLLFWRPAARAWCFQQDQDMSREYQQALIYKYLPAELKPEKGLRKQVTYISYKQQTGFADEHLVLPKTEVAPTGSECSFRCYMQEFVKIQGGEIDVAWCDEMSPATWVKELKARIATRHGWIFVTFTPMLGYTPTVKAAMDIAVKTLESTAFVLPKDGGKPALELAMAGEDLEAVLLNAGIATPGGPASPEASQGAPRRSQPPVPAGREFERVPRAMRLPDRSGAVFFLHSFDNVFGGPRKMWALHQSDGTAYKRMKFYGLAEKAVAQQFAFNAMVHTFKPDRLPALGTRYHIADPCSGRNWFMAWVLVDRAPIGKRFWVYREWPCPGAYVPGVGDMGAWAEPGDKHDGVRGPAQNPLHWGFVRYQQEIRRLEGHREWEREEAGDRSQEAGEKFSFDQQDRRESRMRPASPRLSRLQRRVGDAEDIEERYVDARYGAAPTQTREGDTTLLEECDKVGLHFLPASGAQTTEKGTHWIELINDLLHYDDKQPIGPLNSPRLFISEECVNTIFALQNWTGEDGLKGACMDPISVLKYLVLADLEDWSEEEPKARKGGKDRTA